MSLVSLEVKPNAATSIEVTSPSSAVSVDVAPAIVQSVSVEDANGQYSVELAMAALGPVGPKGDPGRVIDILGTFGLSKTPADLPADGLIPVEWDAAKSPPKTIQFAIGDALTYLPQDTTSPLYGHNFAYTGGTYGSPWLDCGILRGEKGDKGDIGSTGLKGDTGSTGPSNILSIGNVTTGASASASITGLSPNQTLNLVLPKGDPGADGHSPIIGMEGDQVTVDGIVVGPNLTGPQGPKGDVGRSLTIIGYYDTEAALRTEHPIGQLGDCYLVGDGYLYVWGATGWANVGKLQGPKGDTGAIGPGNVLAIGSVVQGATPSVTIRGSSPNQILDFVLAKGDKGDTGSVGPQGSVGPKGDTGSAGPSNELTIGAVVSGATAGATITGTSPSQVLNLILPKGDTGAQGPQGPAGKDASPFESGTRMLFAQTSAPTGWTKDTRYNDYALRVVNGTAGSGGSYGFSSVFTAKTPSGSVSSSFNSGSASAVTVTGSVVGGSVSGSVGATTITDSTMSSHGHLVNAQIAYPGTGSGAGYSMGAGSTFGTGATGGNQGHTHSFSGSVSGISFSGGSHSHTVTGSVSSSFTGSAMQFGVNYLDVIVATKD